MNLTLHLTDRCNLRCRYCFVPEGNRRMSAATARSAVELSHRSGLPDKGFAFFGGEPLLERELIMETVAYSRGLEGTGSRFLYKLTTNGLLLDEEFLRFAADCGMEIALSHDGLMHTAMRVPPDGNGAASFAAATDAIPLLLGWQPNALVMATVCPSTAGQLAGSVEWLYNKGFRRITVTADARPEAGWDEDSLERLGEQYRRIARFYLDRAASDDPFSFTPFEEKIRLRVSGSCSDCRLGYRQPSVAPDGTLYPCIQFVDRQDYAIGHVDSGVDEPARARLLARSRMPVSSCADCALEDRCRHHCPCLNLQMTGDMGVVSPVQCLHERLLIPLADDTAARLFAAGNKDFIRRFYEKPSGLA
jgi:uncharacterized protein